MGMNGRKILNRLIILFLAINLILFILVSIRRGTQYQLSKTRVSNIVEVLAMKNITLEAELPKNFAPKSSGTLTYQGDSVATRNALVKVFFGSDLSKVLRSTEASEKNVSSKIYYFTKDNERLAFDKEEVMYTNSEAGLLAGKLSVSEAKAEAEAFVKRLEVGKLYNEAYVEVKQEREYILITYFPTFNDIPIFDLPIEMQVYTDGIKSAVIYLGEVNTIEDSRRIITPVDRVLFGIEEYIPDMNHIVIKDITLGYKKMQKKGSNLWGEQIVPVYKIMVEGLEKPIFVNAYTNEIVK